MSDRSDLRAKGSERTRRVPLRPLVQPREHGVYGLYAEPVLLGALLALGWAGAAIAVAGAAAVVAQQPATLALADLRRGRSYPRTRVAGVVAIVLSAIALAALVVALRTAEPGAGLASRWWTPLLLALVPAGIQFAADRRLQGKTVLAQTSGAVALSSLAPAIALAGGAPPWMAWTAWAGLALRVFVSIPTVRTRLRLARGQPAQRGPVRMAAFVLPLGAAAALTFGLVNVVPVVVAGLAGARTLWSVRPGAPPVRASHVGIAETLVGLAWVVALAAGMPS